MLRQHSLRMRLLALSVVTIAVALALAWLALTIIFERHIRLRLEEELASDARALVANLQWQDGRLALDGQLPDPRFEQPLGGLYWQIDQDGEPALRSRSLWDGELTVGEGTPPLSYEAIGPGGVRLFLHSADFSLPSPGGERTLRITVGADYRQVDDAVGRFGEELGLALFLIGLSLSAAAAAQVSIGLAPLGDLRREISAIRLGNRKRLDPHVPKEVGPLVDEVNELLAAQEDALSRARTQAGDLAHGLKTPLTILSSLAPGLAKAGQAESAREIDEQVSAMRRRIDWQLARARLGSGRFATTKLDVLVSQLVDLVRRSPPGAALTWNVEIRQGSVLPADEVDAAEAIGNLLENAAKWARSTVHVSAEERPDRTAIRIEDDGPGVAPDNHDLILRRGVRLDEGVDGSGLGLAIVSDIVSAYAGTVELSRSELGGLAITTTWPRQRAG
jgi:signal transduction histidine kinase